MKSFDIKTKVYFGDNALDRLSEIPYKKVLVITDPFLAQHPEKCHTQYAPLAVFYPFLRTFLPDFQVILMDSRGHGRSRLSVHTALHGFSTEDMADDVIALLNHLHLSSVHLLGFSDGANIGLEIACKYPKRLKTLICISANASPDGLLTPLHLAAQMLHSILNLLGNLLLPVLKCSFSSASASSGSSAVSALSTPKVSLPFQKNSSVSATSAVCADKERQRHSGDQQHRNGDGLQFPGT